MQHEPRPIIHLEKQLGWIHKLGGAVSGDLQGRSNSVIQIDRVSDMAPACRFCGSAVGRLRKGTMASASPNVRYFSLSQHATGALQAATPGLEVRGSESE